jgi:hypothetical protein
MVPAGQLSQDAAVEILALADETDLSASESFDIWQLASGNTALGFLLIDASLGAPPDSSFNADSRATGAAGSVAQPNGDCWRTARLAAKVFYYQRDCYINSVYALMRSRHSSELAEANPTKYQIIISITNKALRAGLCLRLIASIERGLKQIIERRDVVKRADAAAKFCRRLAECFFYTVYDLALDPTEAKALLSLLANLSRCLSEARGAVAGVDDSPDSLYSSKPTQALAQGPAWYRELYCVMMTLQLAQAAALSPNAELLSRTADAEPYRAPAGNTLSETLDAEDLQLETHDLGPGSGLDTSQWGTPAPKAWSCLVYARLKQRRYVRALLCLCL